MGELASEYADGLAGGIAGGIAGGLAPGLAAPSPADPYRWLEEISSRQALDWVASQNAVSRRELEARPGFAALHARLAAMFNSQERIPYVSQHGAHVYNFWRDAVHVRGIWRRTSLASFAGRAPAWDTVIDLDELARSEHENWVWAGADCLKPDATRCLVSLSRGGGDAQVVREFDLASRTFVGAGAGGFVLPEAKGGASWVDRDTLTVATDFGPGSMTGSGYPRMVKEWRRGTPLAAARLLYEAGPQDLSAAAYKVFTPGFERRFVLRQIDFYTSELFLQEGEQLIKVDKPDDASAYTVRDQLVLELRSDWQAGGASWPQGALIATDFASFMQGGRDFTLLFTPTPTSSLDGVAMTRSALLVTELDNVKNRLVEWRHVDGAWQRRAVAAPAFGSLGAAALDSASSDQYFLTVNDFLTPSTLYLGQVGSDRRQALKAMPAFFDTRPYVVKQWMARSKDGTQVPYFVVMGKKAKLNGKNPALLYGYGGFEIAMKPAYSGVTGAAWLEQGGVYVLANIRGGGEFGPRWHQAALKQQRQRAFDDFLAVAQDLIARKVSSPRHLGIMGGSNGGLLVGAAMTQRPDLFNAVVCQVPLLDMRRYHTLLPGASWMGEYGDPDLPAEWAAIASYSPYHNVFRDKHYPRLLLTTSTRDDRVHPGHARKMAALMQAQGHQALYWENTEGGHAGAANNDQQALMWALTYTFLLAQLK